MDTMFFVHVSSCIVARCALLTTNYSVVFVYCMCYSLSDVRFAHSCIFLPQLTSAKYKFNVPDVTKTAGGCNMDTEFSGGFISMRQTTLSSKKYEPYFSMNSSANATKHDKLSAVCVSSQLPFRGYYFWALLSPLTDLDRRKMQSPLYCDFVSSRVAW